MSILTGLCFHCYLEKFQSIPTTIFLVKVPKSLSQRSDNDSLAFSKSTLVHRNCVCLGYLFSLCSGVYFHEWVRCTINRSRSTPCKKAEFEYLQIFPGHCLDFFLSVSGKICHSPIKKVKRKPTLIISFSQHSPFFGEQSKILG